MDDVSAALYQRIAALEAQVAFLCRHLNVTPPPAGQGAQPGMPDEIVQMVRSGNVIGAIKLHRDMFGSSLVEAKTIVEGLV